ncbi:MAG: hypothetical protein ACK41P_06535 [Asticcacaulis sp.]
MVEIQKNMGLILMCLIGLGTAACTKAPEYKSVPTEDQVRTFAGCNWEEIKGPGLSVHAFQCPNAYFEADASVPGIVKVVKDVEMNKTYRGTTFRLFKTNKKNDVTGALSAIRAASPGAETCILEPIPDSKGDYALMPVGKDREIYDAYARGDGGDEPVFPCGALGPSEGGFTNFSLLKGADDQVVMTAFPSDLPAFDAKSVKASR